MRLEREVMTKAEERFFRLRERARGNLPIFGVKDGLLIVSASMLFTSIILSCLAAMVH